ncbi:MAG: hypothetical protein OHK0021_19850 [Bryobacter sp.]
MKWLAALLPLLLIAHEGSGPKRPTKADPQLKQARQRLDAIKKKAKYSCCLRNSCDLCAMRYGKCTCKEDLANSKQVCGQCLPRWKNSGATLRRPAPVAPPSEETKAVAALLLEAKKTLVKEKRYACCKRGGCDECTFEADCPCGADLAAGKPVCGSCYHGWHAGEGNFTGIKVEEVALSEMSSDDMPMMFVSGTAQLPTYAPMYMTNRNLGAWTFMTMGQAFLVSTQQSGPRGGDKLFSGNWFMPMAARRVGVGTLTLRGMFSLEPATVTSGRYPQLFQAGETYQGRPIVDGQHPHNFFMELAALYQIPLSDRTSVYFYGGPRGEPALGPIPYPHRISASENPIATLAHHYQDSTHIANNVVTGGFTFAGLTVEASGFNGREPGERRWQLERGAMDSWATRFTFKPAGRWMLSYSRGEITGREALHPEKNSSRQSASLTYVRPHPGGYWASSLIYGRNVDVEEHHDSREKFNSYLAESTALLRNKHWLWTRLEHTDKDATLVDPANEEYRLAKVSAFTFGYGYELPSPRPWLSVSLGGQLTGYRVPTVLKAAYGSSPVGAQVFLRFRLKSSRMTF